MASSNGTGIDVPLLFSTQAEAVGNLTSAVPAGHDPLDDIIDDEAIAVGVLVRGWWQWVR